MHDFFVVARAEVKSESKALFVIVATCKGQASDHDKIFRVKQKFSWPLLSQIHLMNLSPEDKKIIRQKLVAACEVKDEHWLVKDEHWDKLAE